MESEIIKKFGNQLRVRVCGILIEDDRILMVLHHSLGESGFLWAPPGGGMNFGQSVNDNLVREFREETGLTVEIKRFLFINEFLDIPLHAVEIFFEVIRKGGKLITGTDPEMNKEAQIIKEISFLGPSELNSIGKNQLHGVFANCRRPKDLLHMKGYFYNGISSKIG